MLAKPQQELNIDDLRAQQHEDNESKMQSALRREQVKAKKQKMVSSVLGDLPSQSANKEIAPIKNNNNETTDQQNTAENQAQQEGAEEKKVKKIPFWQIKKRKQTIKKLKELDKQLEKLEKLTDKYKSTNFILLAFLASFVDMADLPINLFWATILLIPVAIILVVMKELACLFIWIKIHKIKTDQKTKDGFVWTLLALAIESIPGISALPATVARVFKARNSAKAQFEKHKDEIKEIEKEMKKLIKQLG